jgi:hypothetical protein
MESIFQPLQCQELQCLEVLPLNIPAICHHDPAPTRPSSYQEQLIQTRLLTEEYTKLLFSVETWCSADL